MIWIFEIERASFRVFLALLCFHLLRTSLAKVRAPRAKPFAGPWPAVTIQLPLYNSPEAAARLIEAAAGIEYPGQVELQILDDSEQPAARLAIDASAAKVGATAIRRADRSGFKAGNLNHGLASARGEFVAIFDEDSLPPKDFLTRSIPLFEERIGLVQWRAAYTNRDTNLLTRAQALIFDGLMALEEGARDTAARPLPFNGSAGIWRRACIDDVGGFSSASVAEDLDISLCAQAKGWLLRHVFDWSVAQELPEHLAAFRRQQIRWSRGKGTVLRRLFGTVLTAKRSLAWRFDALGLLLGRAAHVFLALLILSVPLTTFDLVRARVKYTVLEDALLVAAIALIATCYYARASHLVGNGAWSGVKRAPVTLSLLLGLSLPLGFAFLRGVFSRGPGVFLHTPKREHAPASTLTLGLVLEALVSIAYAGFTALAIARGLYPVALFFAWICLATGVVSFASMRQTKKPASKA